MSFKNKNTPKGEFVCRFLLVSPLICPTLDVGDLTVLPLAALGWMVFCAFALIPRPPYYEQSAQRPNLWWFLYVYEVVIVETLHPLLLLGLN